MLLFQPVSRRKLGWRLGQMMLGLLLGLLPMLPAFSERSLFLAYPPPDHETTAAQIFLIGTAPLQGTVQVNGQPIARSAAGHFAPSFPLQLGENRFQLQYQSPSGQRQELRVKVVRQSTQPVLPTEPGFVASSLTPAVDVSRSPGEPICFGAIAAPGATVVVQLGEQQIPLLPQTLETTLPENSAVLTQQNQPIVQTSSQYQGCGVWSEPGVLGQPQFQLTLKDATVTQTGTGKVEILPVVPFQVAEVTAESGTARTGPSTDYSRLTPLPRGTRAAVTGREGDWLRLDYGAWIRSREVKLTQASLAPQSLIRSVRARQSRGWTEIAFPLQVPVPMSLQQGSDRLTLTLHNTTAQTDTIHLDDDPLIARMDWQQLAPKQVQYQFQLKTAQQWGYKLRYEGTTLILSLRHPPQLPGLSRVGGDRPLSGATILLDPGHGGPEDLGARGPTGYPEKDVALQISQLVRQQLIQRGATIVMTRDRDQDLELQDRIATINRVEPTLVLSLHYNALPDSGDAVNTAGIGAFWYQTQAHSLAVFLHNFLTQTLQRPSYGVFWNNLALTRPTVAPSVLLELGFMINPTEFEWVINPQEQQKLATAIAEGVTQWLKVSRSATTSG